MPRYHTKQRAALLSFFEEHADETLSVQQITDALQGAHISLSAVYRKRTEKYEKAAGLEREKPFISI